MTNIITLDRPAFAPGVGSEDFRFPAVYRTEGYYWVQKPENSELITGDTPAPPHYSLDNQPAGFANPKVTLLRHLDPVIDNGWLIVRRHPSEAAANGYVDCLHDQEWLNNSLCGQAVVNLYRTERGIFTLQHIHKQTERHLDQILIFVAGTPTLIEDRYWIVHPDGTVTEDPDLLLAD